MTSRPLTPEKYYRLPWNLSDNAITWLEPTTKCNLYCEGCYRENDPHGHKPLEDVIRDLEEVKRQRRTDGISIAGGEPLIYPDIVALVRYVASRGWKPIINSNGQALTPELVRALTDAGLIGFTMHVDSHQKRPGWTGKSEAELNELRLKLANMIHDNSDGKVACAFNATIYRDTLDDIPMLARFAHEHMDRIQTMVFILFRSARKQANFDVFVSGKQVDVGQLVYQLDHQENHQDIMSQEIADKIREIYPDHEPCAYLNGTEDPRSMKWLLTLRVGTPERILGYMDPKFAEWVQSFHHLLYDTYLAYTRPCWTTWFQKLLPAALFNKGLRKVFGRWLTRPEDWFKPLYAQSIMVIQPCDLFEDGRQNMCDGCPDAIVYKNRLVWSCRVDELEKFGSFIQCSPKGCSSCGSKAPAGPSPEELAEARDKAEALARAAVESQKEAEARMREVAEERAQAVTKAQTEAEARVKAEALAKAEAAARLEAEATAKAEAEARLKAEAAAKAESEARIEAEAKATAEAGARQEAEARLKADQEAKTPAAETARTTTPTGQGAPAKAGGKATAGKKKKSAKSN